MVSIPDSGEVVPTKSPKGVREERSQFLLEEAGRVSQSRKSRTVTGKGGGAGALMMEVAVAEL